MTNCSSSCGSSSWCNQGCTCGGSCSSSCGYCGSSCGDACSGCSGCSGSCSGCSGCGGACSYGCSGCSGCGGSCSYNCTSCSGTCSGTCTDSCSGACLNTCTDACNDGCKDGARATDYANLAFQELMKFTDMERLENLVANELTRRSKTQTNTVQEAVGEKLLAATMADVNANLTTLGKSPTAAPAAGTATAKDLVEAYAALVKELYEVCIPAK